MVAVVETRLPRIGDPGPTFEAETTQGTLRLADFKGSRLILFSHPTSLSSGSGAGCATLRRRGSLRRKERGFGYPPRG